MADTFTANLGLRVADLTDVYDFGAHVEGNFTILDAFVGLVKCTSGTRPSTTYGGQGIYETDTLRVAVNTGTKVSPTWTYVTHGALAGTLAARPTSGRTVGELYYETDTTRLVVWNGSAWEQKAFADFICTSSTHPSSPFQGLRIYETDTGNTLIYSGTAWEQIVQTGAWTTGFVPTWAQSGGSPSLGLGTVAGKWRKNGRSVRAQYRYTFSTGGSFGTGTNPWTFSVPATAVAPAANQQTIGSWSGLCAGTFFTGAVYMNTSGTISLFVNNSTQSLNPTNPGTWNSSSTLSMDFEYETAS